MIYYIIPSIGNHEDLGSGSVAIHSDREAEYEEPENGIAECIEQIWIGAESKYQPRNLKVSGIFYLQHKSIGKGMVIYEPSNKRSIFAE